MPAEDTVFWILYDKYMFWSILVGIFTFGWLFMAILRYRDGVEPDTTELDHIEVGAFPVDRHNTALEAAFYILPTILVVWLTVLALASNSAVWDPDEEKTFEININAYQWYFEFEYTEQLTWEDTDTGIDVSWAEGRVQVDYPGSPNVASIEVKIGTDTTEYEVNENDTRLAPEATYDPGQYAHVKVFDSEGELLHTWMHIQKGKTFNTPSEPMIVPCDELVDATMKSEGPGEDVDERNVGVQHAFWVPEFGMKEDFVPGLDAGTTLYFMPDDPGTFNIRCAEYCGLQHSVMTGEVQVVAREGLTCDFDSGVKKSNSGSSSSYGGGEM